ncbi:uncharacterized protein LOC144432706 [Glandiceps talaboti]
MMKLTVFLLVVVAAAAFDNIADKLWDKGYESLNINNWRDRMGNRQVPYGRNPDDRQLGRNNFHRGPLREYKPSDRESDRHGYQRDKDEQLKEKSVSDDQYHAGSKHRGLENDKKPSDRLGHRHSNSHDNGVPFIERLLQKGHDRSRDEGNKNPTSRSQGKAGHFKHKENWEAMLSNGRRSPKIHDLRDQRRGNIMIDRNDDRRGYKQDKNPMSKKELRREQRHTDGRRSRDRYEQQQVSVETASLQRRQFGGCWNGYDFQCDNGHCIDRYYVCDGANSCGDWSDETICDCSLPDSFYCEYYYHSYSHCLPGILVCDGHDDCRNDEFYCGDRCKGFSCESGRCIPTWYRCNHYPDCQNDLDFSDEVGCACNRSNEYQCPNGVCIYNWQLCDHRNDCGDWSDEASGGNTCEYQSCSDYGNTRYDYGYDYGYDYNYYDFECDNGECVHTHAQCDGYPECQDRSDEIGCADCNDLNGRFTCDNGVCIYDWDVCNGWLDCGEGDISDENNCTCQSDQFICGNGVCVYRNYICDGYDNCGNGDDEIDCDCTVDSFKCYNGFCIPLQAVCDDFDHCGDGSDEGDCGICLESEFQCAYGACIGDVDRCNGWPQCSDHSDEYNCPCTGDFFLCDNDQCIQGDERCNRRNECGDASDEIGCPCDGNEDFLCDNGVCISIYDICDGYNHCIDWSDEIICDCTLPDMFWCDWRCIPNTMVCDGYNHCGYDELYCGDRCEAFLCENGHCLPSESRCDHVPDCVYYSNYNYYYYGYYNGFHGDMSDEIGCACDQEDEYLCGNGVCIYVWEVCDGDNDCGDWSDESIGGSICEYGNCTEYDEFQCSSGQCVWGGDRCNGYVECQDGSDEINCDNCEESDDKFLCDNGICIWSWQVCNQEPNCGEDDVSDEIGCECYEDTFPCDNGVCIYGNDVCNGYNNCGDNSDEKGCVCTDESFVCNNHRCIPQAAVCDEHDHCRDGSDENCGSCGPDEFQCDNGVCINQWDRCNGYPQCYDLSDEKNCKCNSHEDFLCKNGVCAKLWYRYNNYGYGYEYEYGYEYGYGYGNWYDYRYRHKYGFDYYRCHENYYWWENHCSDFSDTIGCFSDCQADSEFLCDNGMCISADFHCDGYPHCTDRSDEKDCTCSGDLMDCGDGYCVPISYECDGEWDCNDGRDESDCGSDCQADSEFLCDNGMCISADFHCDGYPHCTDRSDEKDCTCSGDLLDCGDGYCVPISHECDGEWDCNDGRDESDCGSEQDTCCLPPDFGDCSGSEEKWYYDCFEGVCKTFKFSGCGGNANNFYSKEKCIMHCGADSCCLDPDKGPCDGYDIMWYFDPRDNTCKKFEYGGCEGNNNRYISKEKCELECQAFNKNITCEADRMVVSVAVNWLHELFPLQQTGPGKYHLNDDNCVGKGRYIGGKEYYAFVTGLNECGTTSAEHPEGSRITYTNIIHSERGTEIFELECCYETEYTIAPIKIITNPCCVLVTLKGFGTFNITASLYTSDNFLILFNEDAFPLMICDGVLIYFGIQVDLNDPTLELFTEDCYASESDDPNANVVKYDMIINGCIQSDVDEYIADSLTKHYTWDAYDVVNRYDVEDGEEVTLYIHCKVHVCKKDEVGTRCYEGCIDRKRRTAEIMDADTSPSTSTFITHGPLKKTSSCDN